MSSTKTGLQITGVVRDLAILQERNQLRVLVARNNGPMQLLKVRKPVKPIQ